MPSLKKRKRTIKIEINRNVNMKRLSIYLMIAMGAMVMVSTGCSNKDSEKRIAELENRLRELESTGSSGTTTLAEPSWSISAFHTAIRWLRSPSSASCLWRCGWWTAAYSAGKRRTTASPTRPKPSTWMIATGRRRWRCFRCSWSFGGLKSQRCSGSRRILPRSS